MRQQNFQAYQENLLKGQTEPTSKYQYQLKLVKALYAQSEQIGDCRFNNNENMFITHGFQDKKFKLWDLFTGKLIVSLDGILPFAFNHPFCDHIATVSNLVAKNFDLATRKCQALDYRGLVICISFHPNSQFIATGSYDNNARLWNGSTGKQVQIFNGHNKTIKSLNFNSDGDRLVTFSYDNTARIWDVESGNCIKILGGIEFIVECIEIDNTSDYCVTGTTDHTWKIWNVKSGQCIKTFAAYSDIECLCFNSSRNRIVTVFNDRTCKVYDVQTGKCIAELISENGVDRGHYFGQKNQIITIVFFAPARIYSEAGECLQKFGSNHQITSYSLSQKGNMFISAYHNGLCKIWKNLNN